MNAVVERLERDLAERLLKDLGRTPTTEAIAAWVLARFAKVLELGRLEVEFELRFQAAADEEERRRAVLDLARSLGASQGQLAGDARAFGRYFDQGAVVERVRRRIGAEERAAVFGLDLLGAVGAAALSSSGTERAVEQAWSYVRDPRLREAGFRCIRRALEQATGIGLAERLLWQVQRAALDPGETSWIQNEALTILALTSPPSAVEVMRRRLSEPVGGDDIFVRRHAVRLLAGSSALADARAELLILAAADPSGSVRQCLADELRRCGAHAVEAHAEALSRDVDPKVRAMLLRHSSELHPAGRGLLARALLEDDDPFVLRTALNAAAEWAWALNVTGAADLADSLARPMLRLRERHAQRKVRALANGAAERLWCAADADARELAERIGAATASTLEGRIVKVPNLADDIAKNPECVGRVLAVLAQRDFGFELLSGGRLRRGDLIAFRTWRALHEWRNPSSDKRQAFRHWIGRVWRGRTIAPSAIMAELAPTKVPGEPLFQPDEGDWRPWLPLPDMVLSAVDTGETVSLVTAEGVTEIEPPSRFIARLRARLVLTRRFAEFAALRNWTETSGRPASSYAEALREVGVAMRMRPHPDRNVDPQVARFYSVAPGTRQAVL